MSLVKTDLLLTTLIEIQEKITLLEKELKIQSIFISIDSNGIFYTHASSKYKDFADKSSEMYRVLVSDFWRRLPSKKVDSEVPEFGSIFALQNECGRKNCDDLVLNDRIDMDLKAGSAKISDDMPLLAVRGILQNDVELSTLASEESYELCPCCKTLLPGEAFIRQHVSQVYADYMPFKCPHCFSLFECESELESHKKIHQCRCLFRCTLCSRNFDNKRSIEKHEHQAVRGGLKSEDKFSQQRILEVELFLCRWCGQTFETDFERLQHMSEHLRIGFKCKKCEASFKTWRVLRDHLALVHADSLPFHCQLCSAAFKTALLMCRHIKEAHHSDAINGGNNFSSEFKCLGRHPGNNQTGFSRRVKKETHLCFSCGRCFYSEKTMERHMSQIHGKNISSSKLKNHPTQDHHCTPTNAQISVDIVDDVNLTFAHCNQNFKGNRYLQTHFQNSTCFAQKTKFPMFTNLPVIEENLVGFETAVDSSQNAFPTEKVCTDPKLLSSSLLRKRKSSWKEKNQPQGFSNLCHVCGKNFTLRHYLQQHLVGHWDCRPFECQHCKKRFKRRSVLLEHMALHSNTKRFHCRICQKMFRFASVLRQHVKVHSSERMHDCNICHKKFKYLSGLKRHRCMNTLNVLTTSPLPPHNNVHLPKGDSRTTVEMSQEDKTNRALQLSDPSRPFHCQLCFKRFRLQKDLSKHARVHSEERPFVCQSCHKSFKHPSSLKQHQSVHSDIRPYSCKCCSKKFKNVSGLKEHMDKNSYKCSGCGKQYVRKKSLISHMVACKNQPDGKNHQEPRPVLKNLAGDETATANPRLEVSSVRAPDAYPRAILVEGPQHPALSQPTQFFLKPTLPKPQMTLASKNDDINGNSSSLACLPLTKLWLWGNNDNSSP